MGLIDDFLAAWNQQDGAALARLFTPDGRYADVALGQEHTGAEEIEKFLRDAYEQFSTDMTFDRGYAVETPTGYAVEWTMKGTHDLDGPDLPKTGKQYSVPGVSIGELRDGKIVRNTDYWSLATFLMQVGLMPAPEGATA